MNRAQALEIIEAFYPTDSGYLKTDRVGRELLRQAREDVLGNDWRQEPTAVLLKYAELCQSRNPQITTK